MNGVISKVAERSGRKPEVRTNKTVVETRRL